MLDEVIITTPPPLYSCYGRRGQSVEVPITGDRERRILYGAINIATGEVALLISLEWTQQTHQIFLRLIRKQWRGWNLVLFEDRGTPHTAEESQVLALHVEYRGSPVAPCNTPSECHGSPLAVDQGARLIESTHTHHR